MPSISEFYGITIYMYNEKGSVHHTPHIHALYSGEEIVLDINTDSVLAGSMNDSKKKLVIAWLEIHRDELKAAWAALQEGNACDKINPLK